MTAVEAYDRSLPKDPKTRAAILQSPLNEYLDYVILYLLVAGESEEFIDLAKKHLPTSNMPVAVCFHGITKMSEKLSTDVDELLRALTADLTGLEIRHIVEGPYVN